MCLACPCIFVLEIIVMCLGCPCICVPEIIVMYMSCVCIFVPEIIMSTLYNHSIIDRVKPVLGDEGNVSSDSTLWTVTAHCACLHRYRQCYCSLLTLCFLLRRVFCWDSFSVEMVFCWGGFLLRHILNCITSYIVDCQLWICCEKDLCLTNMWITMLAVSWIQQCHYLGLFSNNFCTIHTSCSNM